MKRKAGSQSPALDSLIGEVWTITTTEISGFPHVEIARDRDQAIAAFMSMVYMFVHVHAGTYTVVGEDNDVALTGLHLIFKPEGVDLTLCVVSLVSPMVIIPQEGYEPPAPMPAEFTDVAAYLQHALDGNKPSKAEQERLKQSTVARDWPGGMSLALLETPRSTYLDGKISPHEARRWWRDMGKVKQWSQGTGRVVALPDNEETNSGMESPSPGIPTRGNR